MEKLIVSPSPHIHSGDSTRKRMRNVLIALAPAYLASLYFFGVGALAVSLISMASCVLFEYLITRFMLRKPATITDGSALLTGLLLAFNLPSNLPWWIVILGALVAIGIGKMAYGGIGTNPFNPALVGRVFLLISFPAQMTTWPVPEPFSLHYMDALTGATPLAAAHTGQAYSYVQLFLGQVGGSMGEVSALALLAGGAYLLATRTIRYIIPASILGTVAVFTAILHAADPALCSDCLTQLLSGGLLLGALFMATDYATSPMTPLGQLIYGVSIGLITVLIRVFGIYPEGMSFAILIMNAVTPLLNRLTPARYGAK